MTTEEEIEESLSVCEELENFLDKREVYQPMSPEMQRELDMILQGDLAPSVSEKKTEDDTVFKMEKLPDETEETLPDDVHIEDNIETKEDIEENTEEDANESEEKSSVLRNLIGFAICIILAVSLSFLVTHFVAHHTEVDGSSMEPALQNKDQIIVEEVSYYMHEPERFDVIVFPFSEGVYYIKRVIGLPGEMIQIKEGAVYINGNKLEDPYATVPMEDAGLAAEEIILAKDEYFVLGDNRNNSVDSRKAEVGVVHADDISGRAWLRFYPFGSFGMLK